MSRVAARPSRLPSARAPCLSTISPATSWPGSSRHRSENAVLHHQPPSTFSPRGASVNVNWITTPASVAGNLVELHEAADVPHEEAGVELAAFQAASDPSRPPTPDSHHDRPEAPRRYAVEVVFQDPLVTRRRLRMTPISSKLAQSPGEQRMADIRGTPALDVVETVAAAEQLAHERAASTALPAPPLRAQPCRTGRNRSSPQCIRFGAAGQLQILDLSRGVASVDWAHGRKSRVSLEERVPP